VGTDGRIWQEEGDAVPQARARYVGEVVDASEVRMAGDRDVLAVLLRFAFTLRRIGLVMSKPIFDC